MSESIRAFIPCDGLVIDGDLVDGKIVGQWQQDIKDGAALRRLREALEPGWDVFPDDDRWCVYGGEAMSDRPEDECWFYGSTIAEAADKCREAL